MTTKELYFKYKDIFILVLESAGEETGNSVYKEVERITKDNEESVLSLIDRGGNFSLVITSMVAAIVVEVHGKEKLANQDISEYIYTLFDLYLKKPTRSFCTQNGVPVIKDIREWTSILRKLELPNDLQ